MTLEQEVTARADAHERMMTKLRELHKVLDWSLACEIATRAEPKPLEKQQ